MFSCHPASPAHAKSAVPPAQPASQPPRKAFSKVSPSRRGGKGQRLQCWALAFPARPQLRLSPGHAARTDSRASDVRSKGGGLSATAGARSPRRPRPEVWLAVCKRDYEQNTSAVKMSQLPGKSQQFPSSTTAPSFLCLVPNCFESHPCAHSPGSAARCPPSAASPRPPTPHLHGTVLLLEAEP